MQGRFRRGPIARWSLIPALTLALTACTAQRGLLATVGPDYQTPQAPLSTAWQAPLPHQGSTERLQAWWRRFDDPVLLQLLDAAQRENANVAAAAARIERARTDAVIANATAWPSLTGTAGASRSSITFGGPAIVRDQIQVGLQSSWEIDLFGGRARQRESAAAALQSSTAAWHDARVSVAAEVANGYLNLRACEQQLLITRDDATSRAESRRLTEIAGEAGFQSPGNVALARAVAAEGASTLAQRRAGCDLSIKALVELTGLEEPSLRQMLANRGGRLPEPPPFALDTIPATVLLQRPDVAVAERNLAAASADIGMREAQRYPTLSLTGNLTPTRIRVEGSPALNVNTWSIGPSLSVPLLDGGQAKAEVRAATAQYQALDSAFRAKVRGAAREVEEALVRAVNADERRPDAAAAARGYRLSFEAAQERHRSGFGSLIEAEEARRLALAADLALATLEQERVSAWIALYRAAGGGWDATPADMEPQK